MFVKTLCLFALLYSLNAYSNPHNFTHRVALTVSVDDEPKGEFYIGLWHTGLEKAVDNFLGLCQGRSEQKHESGHKFDMKGLSFYDIVENQYMKSGDISPNHNWGGNQTFFKDGRWTCEVSNYGYEPGILVHHQTDNRDVGSEFYIWITKGNLHPAYVPFGLVYNGLDLVKYIINTAGMNNGIPKRDAIITGCRVVPK